MAQRPTEAEGVFRQSWRIIGSSPVVFPNDVDYRWSVAMALGNLATVIDQQGRPKEALPLLEESKPIFDSLATKLGSNEAFQKDQATHARTLEAIRMRLNPKKP